jgi:predicted DCC family thiol-disulfide oxidoreductase YuxK
VQRAPYDYRADPAVPRFADDRPVIVFDGKCVLCSSFAQFILRKDRSARFRLLAAQSDLGNALYRHFGLDPMSYVLDGLGGAWSLFATLARLVPASLRDALYDVIARNRLRWFGTREQCYLPGPSQADRFLS